jgi:hypothetical protein
MRMDCLSTQGQGDSVTATTFLAEYHRALSGVMELRAFHDDRTQSDGGRTCWIEAEQDIPSAVEWAQQMNAEGRGIFYSLLPRSEKRGTKEAVRSFPVVFADLDCVKLGITPEEAERQVLDAADIPRPSVINNSTGMPRRSPRRSPTT